MRTTNFIVEVLLRYAGVPYTKYGLERQLQNHPHNGSLWGIGNVLAGYGIASKGIQTNAERLRALGEPVVLLLGGAFVLLTRVGTDTVEYKTEANEHKVISIDEFVEKWDCAALFFEVSDQSKEPKYGRNLALEVLLWSKISVSVGVLLCSIGWLFDANHPMSRPFDCALLGLYVLGIVVSFMLVRQSLGLKSAIEKKICEHGLKVSCILLLQSKGAKLLGVIDWSVVGLTYFWGCLILLLFGQFDALMALAVAALPYTAWSIWYQWRKAKKWCVLCVCVQGLLWVVFLVFLLSGSLFTFSLAWDSVLYGALCFVVPMLILWWVVPIVSRSLRLPAVENRWRELKANETVFSALLAVQPRLELPPEARKIVLGNPSADTVVTVVNNPYCGHCADLYLNVLQRLLFLRRNQIRIELLFVGEPEMQDEIKRLLSAYFRYDAARTEELYAEWFMTHQPIAEPYMLDQAAQEQIDAVYLSQNRWKEHNQSKGTPTVYLNSMQLPDHYDWLDLEYVI